MKYVRRIVYSLLLTAAVNALPVGWFASGCTVAVFRAKWLYLPLAAAFLWVNIRPIPKTSPTKRIQHLAEGCELLWLFAAVCCVTLCVQAGCLWSMFAVTGGRDGAALGVILELLLAVLLLAVVFWNGMIRVYLTSVQLGIKHRVLAALCGWIPLVNV